MHRYLILMLSIGALLLLPIFSAAQPTYQIFDLGYNGSSSVARTITENGWIGGQSNGYTHLWNTPSPIYIGETGCVTHIREGIIGDPQLPGGWSAGGYYGSETSYTSMHGWSGGGCMGWVPDGYVKAAWLDGSTAGNVGYAVHGLGYKSAYFNTDTLISTYACAYGINDSGVVVGDKGNKAFRWTQTGGVVTLNRSSQYTGDAGNAAARSINNSGEIAGYAILGGSINEKHAGYWDTTGTFNEIGRLIGFKDSYALKINNNHQIVGYCTDSAMKSRAFMWQDGEMLDLGTLVSGGQSTAYAINSNGWIVGSATASDGFEHAVLWKTVPEPSALAALACGLSFCLVRVRKPRRES